MRHVDYVLLSFVNKAVRFANMSGVCMNLVLAFSLAVPALTCNHIFLNVHRNLFLQRWNWKWSEKISSQQKLRKTTKRNLESESQDQMRIKVTPIVNRTMDRLTRLEFRMSAGFLAVRFIVFWVISFKKFARVFVN